MNHKIHILILALFLSLVSACASSEASTADQRQIVIFSDEKEIVGDEVVITEADLTEANRQVPGDETDSQNTTEQGHDNSEITIMYDSLGNKTETRVFKGHSRLRSVIVKTSKDGKQQIFVYGFGTDVKSLSGNAAANAMKASADEIANAAGIEARSYNETTNFMKQDKPSLTSQPSSNFPMQTPQSFPSQIPENEPDTSSPAADDSSNPVESNEPAANDFQPEYKDR
jgi:hypothetical protein